MSVRTRTRNYMVHCSFNVRLIIFEPIERNVDWMTVDGVVHDSDEQRNEQ